MGIAIRNVGACISIEQNGTSLLISKLHIKTIDTIGLDSVRINMGEGPLRNIYLKQEEMVEPNVNSVFELRDFINTLMWNNGNPLGDDSIEVQQYDILVQIRDILQQLYNHLTAA